MKNVCALIGYDSGESTLEMVMSSVADENVVTKGGSEYIGDIYIDLETGWVRKVTLNEFVITETVTGSEPAKTGRYTVRHLFLRLISKEEFEAGVTTIEG